MSWRDVEFEDFKKFFKDWKSKKDMQEKFGLTTSETRHAFNFLRKCEEFEFRESMGVRRRFHELRFKNVETLTIIK